MIKQNNKKGYILLMSVLVMSAVGSLLVASSLLFGVVESKNVTLKEQTEQAGLVADSCAEYILRLLFDDPNPEDSGNIDIEGHRCAYKVFNNDEGGKTINVVGVVENIYQKKHLTVNMGGERINVTSWQDVSDF